MNYSVKLPNFLCVEVTDPSVDPSGNGKWRRKDSFGELLRFVDDQETRTTLEVNGRPSRVRRDDMSEWPISFGEFGDLLNLVFQPSSKAEFHWKETGALANGRVQVFEYRVERKNNSVRPRSIERGRLRLHFNRRARLFDACAWHDPAEKGPARG